MIPILLAVFVFGAVFGSFLNVVALRHEQGKQPTGRSECPHCKKVLQWYELVPVLSYILQRGRCRVCGAKLSLQYVLMEVGTGCLFVIIFYKIFAPFVTEGVVPSAVTFLTFLLHIVIWSLFVVITVYDLRTKLIPDVFTYLLSTVAGLLLLANVVTSCTVVCDVQYTAWLAGPLFYLPYWVLWKISDGRWIGLGDAKLSWGIGWFLGLSVGGTAILLAFWIGAVVSLLIMGLQRILQRLYEQGRTTWTLKSEVPFGPFLVLGTLLAYVYDFNLFTLLV